MRAPDPPPTYRSKGREALLLTVLLLGMPTPRSAAQERPGTTAPTRLGLDQAVALAFEANPSLRAAMFDAVAAREDARVAEHARVPTLTASSQGQYQEQFGGTVAGVIRTRSWSIVNSVALSYTTDAGTVLGLTLGNTTQWREQGLTPGVSTVVTVGPTTSATATVTARQPLLRGAGGDAVLAEERAARARALGARADADDTTSQLVRDVLVAYWELWYAGRDLAVRRQGAMQAVEQAERARQQRTLGTLSAADALQFAAAEASLREQENDAVATLRSRAVTLSTLLGAATGFDEADLAVEPPPAVELPPLDALLERLRARSTRIRALEAQVEAARASQQGARSAARPRLDLTGSAGLSGMWMQDGYQGLAVPGSRPGVVAGVGVELELPLVPARAEATRAAASAELDAAEARLVAGVAELEASVATRFAELRAAVDRTGLAATSAAVTAELAEAERRRLALGTTVPSVVLDAQQDERESQLRSDRSRVDAAVASVRLEHDAGVLLRRFRLVASEETP